MTRGFIDSCSPSARAGAAAGGGGGSARGAGSEIAILSIDEGFVPQPLLLRTKEGGSGARDRRNKILRIFLSCKSSRVVVSIVHYFELDKHYFSLFNHGGGSWSSAQGAARAGLLCPRTRPCRRGSACRCRGRRRRAGPRGRRPPSRAGVEAADPLSFPYA